MQIAWEEQVHEGSWQAVSSPEHSPFGISILAILEGGDGPAEFFATTLMM